MKRCMFLLTVVSVLTLTLAGCAQPTPEVIEKEVVVEKPVVETVIVEKEVVVEKPVVETVVVEKEVVVEPACPKERYVFTAPLIHPYVTDMVVGAEDAADELGVELVYLTPAEYNPQKQLELTETAVSMPCVKGIGAVTGEPYALDGAMEAALALGIAINQSGSCPEDGIAPICFATDFYFAGQFVAERLAEDLGNTGKVVVSFGSPGDENHQKRVDGLKDWFEENAPDIEILGQVVDCDNAEGTVRCAEEALATFPEMNAYYSTGAMNAVGATQVFPAAGRDDIIITGVDDAPEILDAIRQGVNLFSYAQNPYGQGYLHVYLNWLMVHKGVKPTQKFVDTRIFFIDKDNVETYKETMKQNFLEVKEYIETKVMK